MNSLIISKIKDRLAPRLALFDIKPFEIKEDFDLVKSGLVNSMEFVELLAGLEEDLNVQIDYEKVLEDDDFTTIKGIVRIFSKY